MPNSVDGDLVTPAGIVVPAEAMVWRFSRGTGPGGQGVNTTDSRVELVVELSAVVAPEEVAERIRDALGGSLRIVAATERSQLRNREAAMRRLAERLDAAARPRLPRTRTRRTAGSVRRRLKLGWTTRLAEEGKRRGFGPPPIAASNDE